jgi:glycosyltransferase involved in cell wall biosynthesis/peptidoglycan/xylan/chitin deacetylase (PgdA/CDA1 family)
MRLTLLTNCFPSSIAATAGTFNLGLAKELAREHDVTAVVPIAWTDEWRAWRGRGLRLPASRAAEMDGIRTLFPRFWFPPRVARHKYDTFLDWSLRTTLQRLAEKHRPDVVLSYWAHPDGAVGVRWARKLGVPGWIMVGGSDVLLLARDRRRGEAIDRALREADGIITVSRDLAEAIISRGLSAEKVHVVYRGVDPQRFQAGNCRESRERLGMSDDRRVLAWVGRMVEVKGLDVLVSAVGEAKRRGGKFRLYLIGDGPQRSALQSLADANDLNEHLVFVGSVPHNQLPAWYQAADYTVLSSRSEGVPNVLLESHACGTPFIATAVGGVPEIAVAGVDTLVERGDVDALAASFCNAAAKSSLIESRLAGTVPTIDSSARQISELLCGRARSMIHVPFSALSNLRLLATDRHAMAQPVLPWSGSRNRIRQLARMALGMFLPTRIFAVCGRRREDAVFLTFDDGPVPDNTSRVLDALAEAGAQATFFVVGEKAEKHADLVRRIVREGHAVGIHTWSHCDPRMVSAAELLSEVKRTQALLYDLTGVRTALFRPPHGKVSLRQLWTLAIHGYTVALWNVDPKDYACTTAAEVHDRLAKWRPRAGDIVLLHDRMAHAAEVVRLLLRNTKERSPELSHRNLNSLCGPV